MQTCIDCGQGAKCRKSKKAGGPVCLKCYEKVRSRWRPVDQVCTGCGRTRPCQYAGRCSRCYLRGGPTTPRARLTREQFKARRRAYKLWRKYGLSAAQVRAMFEAQDGACAICREGFGPWAEVDVSFAVDHCHAAGHVRGLLCNPCNKALGCARDRPEVLRNAAVYLERAMDAAPRA